VGKQIYESRVFIPIRQKQLQKVTTVIRNWVILKAKILNIEIHEVGDSTALQGGEESGVCFALRQPQFFRMIFLRDAPCPVLTQQE